MAVKPRSIAVLLFSLMAAAFVQAQSLLQANFLRYGCGFDLKHLPLPTDFFNRFHSAGYILPMIAFAAMFLKPGEGEKFENIDDAVFYAVCLLSVFWMLLCVVSWQLPAYYPIVEIK
ncbi:MAG TPA: hypothetical protein PK747_10700 [Acidobacteriota bacterium]|nr:hypothetical protein [Acidobacteriota bacterium]HQQ47859.1 hypothetical protein [Acidobacteriota bacterium]